ncbi:MAG: hypothetical protein WB683_11975 [Candidatus Sulfotelmatobacter sp.]
MLATDGPYLETKEHIGGFWVLEVALHPPTRLSPGAAGVKRSGSRPEVTQSCRASGDGERTPRDEGGYEGNPEVRQKRGSRRSERERHSAEPRLLEADFWKVSGIIPLRLKLHRGVTATVKLADQKQE